MFTDEDAQRNGTPCTVACKAAARLAARQRQCSAQEDSHEQPAHCHHRCRLGALDQAFQGHSPEPRIRVHGGAHRGHCRQGTACARLRCEDWYRPNRCGGDNAQRRRPGGDVPCRHGWQCRARSHRAVLRKHQDGQAHERARAGRGRAGGPPMRPRCAHHLAYRRREGDGAGQVRVAGHAGPRRPASGGAA